MLLKKYKKEEARDNSEIEPFRLSVLCCLYRCWFFALCCPCRFLLGLSHALCSGSSIILQKLSLGIGTVKNWANVRYLMILGLPTFFSGVIGRHKSQVWRCCTSIISSELDTNAPNLDHIYFPYTTTKLDTVVWWCSLLEVHMDSGLTKSLFICFFNDTSVHVCLCVCIYV